MTQWFGGLGVIALFVVVLPLLGIAGLWDSAKMLLFVAMWVGRLEILTVLALLHPHVWRSLRLTEGALPPSRKTT